MTGLVARLIGLMLLWAVSASGGQQAPVTLDTVLQRASAYVEQYQSDLTSIVAEERYVQDVRTSIGSSRASTRSPNVATHTELASDLIFLQTSSAERWMQYRDVFAVDGKAVRDRTERLMRLLANPELSDRSQVDGIVQESARFNIGPARRTLNMPMLALVFLYQESQPRVKFSRVSAGNVERFSGVAKAEDIWAVEYREGKAGTMIRGAYDRDMPSRGRFWIDSTNGAILRSEMIAEDPTVSDRIEVTYGFDAALQLLVPAEMREMLTIRSDNTRVEGHASYTKFRKFSVETDEELAPAVTDPR